MLSCFIAEYGIALIYSARIKHVASQKCAVLCLNSCLLCNYVDIYYVRKQQPNKAAIKQKNKPSHSQVTWSNAILNLVSGHREKT